VPKADIQRKTERTEEPLCLRGRWRRRALHAELILHKLQDLFKELGAILFEKNEMRSILDHDIALCRRMDERTGPASPPRLRQ
jgi:hypothetical protein